MSTVDTSIAAMQQAAADSARLQAASISVQTQIQGATTSAQTINDFNDIVGYYADDSLLAKGWVAFSKNGGIGK